MNFRFLLLFAALGLSACNGSDSSDSSTTATSTFDAETAAAQAKLDGLNAEIGQKTTALTAAGTKLTQTEQADAALAAKIQQGEEQLAGLLVEAAAKTGEVETASTTLKDRRDELAGLEGPNGRIETLNREIAGLEKTRDGLAGVKDGDPGEIARLKGERDDLEKRRDELKGVEGDQTKPGLIKLADDELKVRKDELADLMGDPRDTANPGKIKLAMDELATYEGTGGKIETAKTELARLETLKNAAIEDARAAKLEAAHIRSDGLIETGRFAEAAKILDAAGLTAEGASLRAVEAFVKDGKTIEAAGKLKEFAPVKSVAALFTRAGKDEEAYKLYAPEDYELEDPNTYMASKIADLAKSSLESSVVNEISSVKRHSMSIRGKTVWFTARAGHLIAYAPKSESKEMRVAKASIFYTSYTREDLPKEKRPVTFFYNGGPGSASIWLHLGSWAPQRLISNAPEIPEKYKSTKPQQFDKAENAETLLDQTDLVFYDPVGTGLSQAISPNKNKDFWQVDKDAGVLRDFVTRYTNYYNRQASPKYLYGESYGGIRTPIAAYLLLQAGTADYEHDPSGKPPTVLTGLVLNSPILDYSADCGQARTRSCAGYLPSYAILADFHKKAKVRGDKETIAEYYEASKKFTAETFTPFADKFSYPAPPPGTKSKKIKWLPELEAMAGGKALLTDLETRLGISRRVWEPEPLLNVDIFREKLLQGQKLSGFDGRMYTPSTSYDADKYIDDAFLNQFRTMRTDYLNYKNDSTYTTSLEGLRDNWDFKRPFTKSNATTSLPELTNISTLAPGTKILILGGYHDIRTPPYQTELDLKNVNLQDRIVVKNFAGGHMTYNTEESRAPMKAALDAFYEAPPYAPSASPVTAAIVSGALQ